MPYDTSMPLARLTYYAGELGQRGSPDVVEEVLPQLLRHSDPIVREGALLGVRNYADRYVLPDIIMTEVYEIAEKDPHGGVRRDAEEIIEDYGDAD